MDGPAAENRAPRGLGRIVAPWICTALAFVAVAVVVGSRPVALGASYLAVAVAGWSLGHWASERRSGRAAGGRPETVGIQDALGVELVRCRRWERPLTVLRFEGPVANTSLRALEARLRVTDELVHDSGSAWVLMPEESVIGAGSWWYRVAPDMAELATPTIAQFPVDALTVEGLIAHAVDGDNLLAAVADASHRRRDEEPVHGFEADDIDSARRGEHGGLGS